MLRRDVLAKIEAWFTDTNPDAPRLFWLNGLAGIGKSTIAQSVAHRAHELGILGANLFFSQQDDMLRDPALVLPTIAFQLSHFHSILWIHIAKALEINADIGNKARFQQMKELIQFPILNILPFRCIIIIILDPLNECKPHGAADILQLLSSHTSSPLFFFITSRPERHIRDMLDPPGTHTKVVLHNIEQSVVQANIELFIRSSLKDIPRSFRLPPRLPGQKRKTFRPY